MPTPVEPKVSIRVEVPPPNACAVKTVVEPETGSVAVTAVAGTSGGHVTVEVNAGNAAPAGTAVCVQETTAVVAAAAGVQLTPIAGAFSPSVAGAVMVRFAPAVIA